MTGIRASKHTWLPLCLSLLAAALWLPQVRLARGCDHNVSDLLVHLYAVSGLVAKLLF